MFTHLHLHTEFSLLDGACRIDGLMKRVADLGQTAVAITDHGVMYGAVAFYKAAKAAKIKPVIGCEVYVAARTRQEKVYGIDSENSHLVLLCENETGYRNLMKLVSIAYTEGFYFKPRVDHTLLEQYHEGLIALSACLAGEIPRKLTADDYDGAKKLALYYRDLFGADNYFIEIQDHGLADQQAINPLLIKLAGEIGVGLVCTNDAHYLTKEDAETQRVLMCIQTVTTLDDPTPLAFETEEFYVKSEQEMRSLFPAIPAAFDNTALIADRCNLELVFGATQLPHFDAPGGDSFAFFRDSCLAGLRRLYGDAPPTEVTGRLEYEMNTIQDMGYTDYYLIVNDFIQFAKNNNIPVGPGRGSGAGSLCAYCLGITGIDPMKYDLLFERFLNPERVTMPDFDIDLSDEKRQRVIEYVIGKYGADHVAQIVTFGTLKARAAIRDVARAMGIPLSVADTTAKQVPWQLGITIEEAIKQSPQLMEAFQSDPEVKRLLQTARKVEGMPRHASTHAAGVVVTDRAVDEYVPLCVNGDLVATQYSMTELEELGLLKIDFLGLRNLSVIEHTEEMIRGHTLSATGGEPNFQIGDIPLDSEPVYRMLSEGHTEGVFQLESSGMKRVLSQLKPDCFEDIIAVISLYRPGPMDSIPRYVHNRHNPQAVRFAHPRLQPILAVTYGCIVYQEQLMQVFRELAGYSLGRADIVRRAVSKKKADVMEREREYFLHGMTDADGNVTVEGCIRRGVPEATGIAIWSEMASFASYAFNKSHAAAYAMVAYQTAYLKCHHPLEYMAALLSSAIAGGGSGGYTEECRRLGIEVLPPHINHSFEGFTVENGKWQMANSKLSEDKLATRHSPLATRQKGAIRYGLLPIKNLGRNTIRDLIEEREGNGAFTGFYDFCRRMSGRDFNKRALENLIKCGALDGMDANRRQMMIHAETVMGQLEEVRRRNIDGQIGFFDPGNGEEPSGGGETLPDAEEYPLAERLAMEKEITGIYLTGHPLQAYAEQIEKLKATPVETIVRAAGDQYSGEFEDGDRVALAGLMVNFRTKTTKNNAEMAYADIEDLSGSISLLIFPKVLTQFRHLLRAGAPLIVYGRLSIREDEPAVVMADRMDPLTIDGSSGNYPVHPAGGREPARPVKKSGPKGLWLRVSGTDSPEYKRTKLTLAVFAVENGQYGSRVYIRLTDTGELLQLPPVLTHPVMTGELRRILGEENVALVE